jgi:hypothetical protein
LPYRLGRFTEAIDTHDILDGSDVRAKAAVNAQELTVHQGSKWEAVKAVHDCVVDFDVVLVQA